MPEVAPAPRPQQGNAPRMDQYRRMRGRAQYHLDDGLGELLGRGGLPGHSLEPGRGTGKVLGGQERGPNVVLLRAGELHVMGELVDQRGPRSGWSPRTLPRTRTRNGEGPGRPGTRPERCAAPGR